MSLWFQRKRLKDKYNENIFLMTGPQFCDVICLLTHSKETSSFGPLGGANIFLFSGDHDGVRDWVWSLLQV
jgi:hypothetical protein